MGAVYDIIGAVNYYLEQVENKPQGLDKYITAYRALLTQRFGRAGGSEHYVASHHPHPNSARGLLSGESRLN